MILNISISNIGWLAENDAVMHEMVKSTDIPLSMLPFIKTVDSKGCLLNLDIGTMFENSENILELIDNVSLINYVHISELGLKPIKERSIHWEIRDILVNEGYKGFVSIEM